jgi:hypothetical protein
MPPKQHEAPASKKPRIEGLRGPRGGAGGPHQPEAAAAIPYPQPTTSQPQQPSQQQQQQPPPPPRQPPTQPQPPGLGRQPQPAAPPQPPPRPPAAQPGGLTQQQAEQLVAHARRQEHVAGRAVSCGSVVMAVLRQVGGQRPTTALQLQRRGARSFFHTSPGSCCHLQQRRILNARDPDSSPPTCTTPGSPSPPGSRRVTPRPCMSCCLRSLHSPAVDDRKHLHTPTCQVGAPSWAELRVAGARQPRELPAIRRLVDLESAVHVYTSRERRGATWAGSWPPRQPRWRGEGAAAPRVVVPGGWCLGGGGGAWEERACLLSRLEIRTRRDRTHRLEITCARSTTQWQRVLQCAEVWDSKR